MGALIGIRREDKSIWERRVPVVPRDVHKMKQQHDIEVLVQPSEIRAFSDEEFVLAGATVLEDLSPCPVVFAIKEIPDHALEPGKAYVFFGAPLVDKNADRSFLGEAADDRFGGRLTGGDFDGDGYGDLAASAIFNDVVAARFDTIDRVFVGDLAKKTDTGGVFAVEDVEVDQPRADALQISPTGPIVAARCDLAEGRPGEIEPVE